MNEMKFLETKFMYPVIDVWMSLPSSESSNPSHVDHLDSAQGQLGLGQSTVCVPCDPVSDFQMGVHSVKQSTDTLQRFLRRDNVRKHAIGLNLRGVICVKQREPEEM
jgi:hypothetical protein